MTQYTPKYLEDWFKRIAVGRISQKKAGKSEYAKDAGYWDGGRCEWGASHNLTEDCEKLASFFTGITELRNARQELVKFNTRQEFEKNKQSLSEKVNKAINGLQTKTSNNSSIAGVCIIWESFADHFGNIISDFRKDLELLKKNIENVPYNEAKELQKLNIEEGNLKREIEENERRARNEPDENKKKAFILLANEAKEKWKGVLERKARLKTSRLGDNFNPDQHIDDFLKAIESKLSGRNRPQRPIKNTNQQPTNSNNPTSSSNPTQSTSYNSNSDNQEPKSFLERYWKELFLGIAFLLGVYYIYKQPEGYE